jgi:hypothetical protein
MENANPGGSGSRASPLPPSPGAAAAGAAAPLGAAPSPCLTPWRLAAFSAPLTLASLVLLALTLTLPWQSYTAQNTAQTMQWAFASCYSRPTGIAGGAATVCDPPTPANLVYACLAIDALALALALFLMAQPYLPPYVPGARMAPGSAAAGQALLAARAVGALRVAHLGMCVGAMVLKTASLPATPWAVQLAGWNCLAGAIAMSCAAMLGHLALCYQEAWLEPLPPSSVVEGFVPALEAVGAASPLQQQKQKLQLLQLQLQQQRGASAEAAAASSRASGAAEGSGGGGAPSASRKRQELAARLAARQGSGSGSGFGAAAEASSGGGAGATAPRIRQAVPELPMELLRTR